MHILLCTCWDVEAAALVKLYYSTLCWVKTFWMPCFICAVTQTWTKTWRSLLILRLCVDSILLCCCGQYSFYTQWDREVSMDVSLARAKSHFSSVAGAVKHMQPFKAFWKDFSLKGQLTEAILATFLSWESKQYCPLLLYVFELVWVVRKKEMKIYSSVCMRGHHVNRAQRTQ